MRVPTITLNGSCQATTDIHDYLIDRGWNQAMDGHYTNYAKFPNVEFSFAEAVALEMFNHLYLMQSKDATN
jgi:hypothetical protein